MRVVGRSPAHGWKIVPLEHIEHLQYRKALAVGWDLPNIVSTVVGRDRFDPFVGVVGKVLETKVPSVAFAKLDDRLGDGASIKVIRSELSDAAIRLGQARIAEFIARLGSSLAVDQEGRLGVFPRDERLFGFGPIPSDHR